MVFLLCFFCPVCALILSACCILSFVNSLESLFLFFFLCGSFQIPSFSKLQSQKPCFIKSSCFRLPSFSCGWNPWKIQAEIQLWFQNKQKQLYNPSKWWKGSWHGFIQGSKKELREIILLCVCTLICKLQPGVLCLLDAS